MHPSVSLLKNGVLTVNVNVIGLLMNTSQVLIHSMLNWNLELLGKQKYPEKNLSEQGPENQQQTQPTLWCQCYT